MSFLVTLQIQLLSSSPIIKSVILRALEHSLPPAAPPISKSQKRKLQSAKRQSERPPSSPVARRTRVTQFVMNLPDTAILFLGAFRGLLSPANVGGRDLSGLYTEMPMVHCYCFTREFELDKAAADIRQVGTVLCIEPIVDGSSRVLSSDSSMSLGTLWATRCRITMYGRWHPRRRCFVLASDSHEKSRSKGRL